MRSLLLSLLLLASVPGVPAEAVEAHAPRYAPGRFAVEPGARPSELLSVTTHRVALNGWRVIETTPQGEPEEQAAELSRRLRAEVHPVRMYDLLGDPVEEPLFGEQWSLENTGQTGGTPDADIDAAGAWAYTTGAGAVVAVVDSGVDLTHPELAGRLWSNPGEVPGNGVDDEGNGLVDDVVGWDFYDSDAVPDDDVGHGTAVAAIAAASADGSGMAGVAPSGRIMAIRACTFSGCPADAVADGVFYAALMGADVVNLSLGGPGNDPLLDAAIGFATSLDVLVVAAAGNDGVDVDATEVFWAPVEYTHGALVGVAWTGPDDSLHEASNHGSTSVEVGAPGGPILVPLLGASGYSDFYGTSFAAPHVAGVAALMRSVDPGITAVEMAGIIRDHGDPVAALAGKTVTGRRLSALTAVYGARFRDIPASVYAADVMWLAATGVTKGCNPPANDYFCPQDPVTRGQVAAFLVRALGLPATTQDFFTDDEGSVFEGDINRLAASGITKGCGPISFCPDHQVTRGQMAAFLVRAFDYTTPGTVDFVDDDGSIFEADIERLAAAGVTKGCNPPANDRFCPDEPVIRGQMAAFLHRAHG